MADINELLKVRAGIDQEIAARQKERAEVDRRIAELLGRTGHDEIRSQTEEDERQMLEAARRGNSQRVLELLEESNVDINAKCERHGYTAMHRAAESGDVQFAMLLIGRGANLGCRDNQRRTPLHTACSTERALEIAKVLIRHGADVNAKRNDGMSPLHDASMLGVPGLVHFLINNGAQIEAQDTSGKTPLYHACNTALVSIARLLLENGANVNAQTMFKQLSLFNGWTPLHAACYKGYLGVVQLLLNRGANANVKAQYGHTPLLLASEGDHMEVVWFLLCQYPELVLE